MADLGPVAWPPEPIRTERLVLREPGARDRAAFIELLASPEVGTYLGGPRPRGELEREMPGAPERRPGLFVADLDGAMIGQVILTRATGHGPPAAAGKAELGYLFLPEAWGFGYAAEACAAALRWFAGELPGEPVVLFTQTAVRMQALRNRFWLAGVDVLQPVRSHILMAMSDPQPGTSGLGHAHDPEHGHDHAHEPAVLERLRHMVHPHSHDTADKVDAAMETSAEGIRALWVSLAVLGITATIEAAIVAVSGSVALLGDTLHNAADALTAVPLGIAFLAGRRPPNRRYTYGYGRAEDLAGVVIVLVIAASSALAGYEAVTRLAHPRPVSNLIAVAVAALVGFAGNEIVARYRIRVGRKIGSAALVADGLHARTDGFTSLAVLLGAGGVALGWDWADPVIGLVITVAILVVLRQAAREIYRRLMDAVDPALVDEAERTLRATAGVLDVGQVRLRWIGHQLRAECEVIVDSRASAIQAHQVAVDAEHNLLHALPRLTAALVHADPQAHEGTDFHAALAPHR